MIRDGAAGDDLADEHDAAARFRQRRCASHSSGGLISSKRVWPGIGTPRDAGRFGKREADDADVRLAFVQVGLGAGRRKARDQVGRHGGKLSSRRSVQRAVRKGRFGHEIIVIYHALRGRWGVPPRGINVG